MTATGPLLPSQTELAAWVEDARRRTMALIADLSDEQLLGPHLSIVNPLLWELGHLAWFQERWVLRHAGGQAAVRADADSLYDSAGVLHDTRWELALPSREQTLGYLMQIRDGVLAMLERPPSPELAYFVLLSVFHEDMHQEAFLYTRQTLAYPAPREMTTAGEEPTPAGEPDGCLTGDVFIPGGTFHLGAVPGEPFVFDNEKWAHAVAVAPYAIARTAVTQAEYAAFVDDGGYRREELWQPQGWQWRLREQAEHPVYWRRTGGWGWMRRVFESWLPVEPNYPMLHVNWYEAHAYCRWAGRRLPSEAEWEMAAAAEPTAAGHGLAEAKRRFPWGNGPPTPRLANLDGRMMGCVAVGALPEGDSSCGCRQMIGNVWEWTGSDFLPYPGFAADPYKEYSQPWFGTHKVLRGGCWATRARLLRNTWRNFYTPDRRDIWAGFRTCSK
jgi:iron(II)-dependent oxidoreductase